MTAGVTTSMNWKKWQDDVPCCTTRSYDHEHAEPEQTCEGFAPIDVVADAEADIAETFEEKYKVECTTCGARENTECITVGGNPVPGGHAARQAFVTETEEGNESETE